MEIKKIFILLIFCLSGCSDEHIKPDDCMIVPANRRYLGEDTPPDLLDQIDIINGDYPAPFARGFDDVPVGYLTTEPQILYYNENFYQSVMEHTVASYSEGKSRMRGIKYMQDLTYELSPNWSDGGQSSLNYHTNSVMQIDNFGRLYIVQAHQTDRNRLFKANAIEDVSLIEVQAERPFGATSQYGMLYKNPNDGTFHFICKDGTNQVQFFNATGQTMENWDAAGTYLTTPVNMSPDQNWHYARGILNQNYGGYNHICIQRRFNGIYQDNWYIKTADWINFENIDGSFSKNVPLNGYITEAELANYETKGAGNEAVNFSADAHFVDHYTGYPVFINGGGSYINWYDGASWHFDNVKLGTKISNLAFIQGAHKVSQNRIRFFAIVSDATLSDNNYRIDMYYSDDYLQNITLEKQKYLYYDKGSRLTKLPNNYWEIPKGFVFPVVTCSSYRKFINDPSNPYTNDIQIRWFRK